MKQIFRKENPYQAVEDIAMAVQHKRTKETAIDLVQKVFNDLQDDVQNFGDLDGGVVLLKLEDLIKNIQNLPQ